MSGAQTEKARRPNWVLVRRTTADQAADQGCSGAGTRRDGSPLFRQGDASPIPPLFGLKFAQKLVHCCNWLLTETQCKIISVQQNYISICYRHSNTSSCIAGQDQRSAVAIFLTCMSVGYVYVGLNCLKFFCLSLVSGVPHCFFMTTPCCWWP